VTNAASSSPTTERALHQPNAKPQACGLAGIRERVNQLGGIVTLASPGDGFRIIAELPIAHLELERGRDE